MSRTQIKRFLGVVLLVTLVGISSAVAQEANRAAIVISLGDGETISRCVDFSEEQLSGYELLSRADLLLEMDIVGLGTTVCRIEEAGCPANDCFCQCKGGGPCEYWSYWHQNNGEWTYSQVGASMFQVKNGDVDGWVWGAGSPNEAIPPPLTSFEEVCSTQDLGEQVEASGETMVGEASESIEASAIEVTSETVTSVPTPADTSPSQNPGGLWPLVAGIFAVGFIVSVLVFRVRGRAK